MSALCEKLITKAYPFYFAVVFFQLFAAFPVHVDAPAALTKFDPMLSARWRDASLDGIDYSYVTNVPHQAVWMYVPASVMWHNDEELRQSFFDFDTAGNTTELTIENFEYAMLHCDGVSQPRDGPETGWSSWLEW